MFGAIRVSKPFRRVRRSKLIHALFRPIWDRQLLRRWWAEGRPNPPPHSIKLASIVYLGDSVGAKYLVETGAYLGDTVRALQGRFDRLYSIELAESLALPLQAEFASDPSIRIVIGDSGKKLATVLPEIDGPAVFWLDAHYSGGVTVGDGAVPIFAEIKLINSLCLHQHAILIDDMIDFKGDDGYPTTEALKIVLTGLGYRVSIFNNMMHCLSHA